MHSNRQEFFLLCLASFEVGFEQGGFEAMKEGCTDARLANFLGLSVAVKRSAAARAAKPASASSAAGAARPLHRAIDHRSIMAMAYGT